MNTRSRVGQRRVRASDYCLAVEDSGRVLIKRLEMARIRCWTLGAKTHQPVDEEGTDEAKLDSWWRCLGPASAVQGINSAK